MHMQNDSFNSLIRSEPCQRVGYEPVHPQEQFIVPLLRQHIENIINEYVNVAPPRGRALDIGCGRQPFRTQLEAGGLAYIGFDVQQNVTETVDFLCAIDTPLPLEAASLGTFDFILCTEVLEHVADWNTAFTNITSLLKTGGKILITCPHFYQLHEEPFDFWRATPYALRYHASRAGLEIVSQEEAGDAWDVLGTLLANCSFSPSSRGFVNRAINKLVCFSKRGLFYLLRTRRLQRRVDVHGPLYLANVIVLTKV